MQLPRLVEWRRRRALAVRDLAARSGVGTSTINRLELGYQLARPSTARRLAEALGVDPAELMPPAGTTGPDDAPAITEGDPS